MATGTLNKKRTTYFYSYHSPAGRPFTFSKAVDHCLQNGYSKSDLSLTAGSCLLSLQNFGETQPENREEAIQ